MPKRSPEQHQLLKDWSSKQRKLAEEQLPASREKILSLFESLDLALSEVNCDRSLRFTLEWARRMDVDTDLLIPWLNKHGGYCDCEVFNVEDLIEVLGD